MSRRLYRSRTDTILGGVASGLAAYLDTDPALVRIAWALLVPLTGGAALVAYILAWIVVPEAPVGREGPADEPGDTAVENTATGDYAEPEPPAETADRSDGRAGVIVGIGLVLLGLWFLLREYVPQIDWGFVWPLVVVGIGALILLNSLRRS